MYKTIQKPPAKRHELARKNNPKQPKNLVLSNSTSSFMGNKKLPPKDLLLTLEKNHLNVLYKYTI